MNKLEMCRVCTNFANSDSSIKLFDRRHSGLLRQIKEITGSLLKHAPNLPQHICIECKEDLKQAYAFRTRCLDSQLYFCSANYKEIVNSESDGKHQPLNEETVIEVKNEIIENDKGKQSFEEYSDHDENSFHIDCNNEQAMDEEVPPPNVTVENPLSIRNSNHKKDKQPKIKRKSKSSSKVKTDFICDQCGNHFRSRQHFLTHLRRHTKDKPFPCEICPDRFFTHSELKRHMRRHTGEKPFACKYCQRSFADYSTRSKHERTHTNERPFACSQCGKAFTTSYILKNHMLLHTGERSFKCLLCDKSFQRQTHLTVHFRSLMHKQMAEKQEISKASAL